VKHWSIDTESIELYAREVNTKSINSPNKGCASSAVLVTGATGRSSWGFRANHQAIGGPRRSNRGTHQHRSQDTDCIGRRRRWVHRREWWRPRSTFTAASAAKNV